MKKFAGKRVFVTGAGSGFGRAIALEFARMGWKVGIGEINLERAEESKKLIEAAGGEGLVIECDVTKEENLQKAAGVLVEKWGGVDVVVNNAGVAGAGRIESIPEDQWDWIIALNLKSVIYGCKIFTPILEKQGGGHFINMASSAGIACLPEMSCYNVTKAAVISLSETLRAELGPKKIGVTVVAPTFFASNLMESFRSTDESQRRMANKFFKNSKATAEQVARYAIKCMKKDKLYSIYQTDGKFVWLAKRLLPEVYFNTIRKGYSKKIIEKALRK